ncbi:MAG: type II secretion system secretin GspD [Candidatus Brocadiae bacterium]|nr:type II secretion system secretin GspD [Candidatus Brocadiia bacterium]
MKRSLLLFFCLVWMISSSPFSVLQAQEEINLNFINTELELFITYVAKKTNKRILYDSTIKGRKIFLVSATSVSEQDLYKIFLSVMEYNGYILETTGANNSEIIKVKRNIQGPWTQTRTLYTEKELESIKEEDQFITMVIKLDYISSREVQTTLRALRIVNPQGGNLAGIEGSNTILITDFAPNVKRIYDVIKLMDQQGPEQQFKVIKLKYASADDVVEKLTEFVSKDRPAAATGMGPDLEQIKISPDRRLNAVIVQAYQEKMKRMISLIEELDQELLSEPSNIHYIRLKHADATKLQETLSKLLEGGGLTKRALGSTGKVASTTGSTSGAKEVVTSIQAEPQTNSLIVKAENYEWKEIEGIIKQVDIRRPQVLIESALIEISPEDVFGLGLELFWAESPNDDGVTFGGGSDFGFSNLVTVNQDGSAKTINDKTTSIDKTVERIGKIPVPKRSDIDRGITAFMNYKDVFTMPMLLKAIKKDGDFKILSIPSILTNDHERAEIKVADAAPASSSTENNSGSRTDSFSGFQEAGTTLSITPHISGEKNYLRLDIEQTIDEFDRSQSTISGVPPKKVRKIATSITVPDGQTVVIGGFTYDSESETVEKIPLFGDLPIVGILFQTRIVNHQKRNIYLFVTPHILRESNFNDLFKHSYDYKVKAQSMGANVGMIDKAFARHQNKYAPTKGGLSPVYMVDYKTPENEKK